jgi:hypothetical protein
MNVVFTCHLKESTDQITGQVFFKPALQGGVGDEVANYMDLALLLRSKTKAVPDGTSTKMVTERYLQTFKDSQHDWIKDRSGQLPSEVVINFEDDYQRMYEPIFGFMADDFKSTEPPVGVPVDVKPKAGGATTPVPVGAGEEASYTCEECGNEFTDSDQRDLSVTILRRVLDKACYNAATEKKK